MEETAADEKSIYETPRRQQAMEAKLVLDAVGIPAALRRHEGRWFLLVDAANRSRAAAELEAYQRENAVADVQAPTLSTYSGASAGTIGYAATVTFIHILDAPAAFDFRLSAAGRMQAGQLLSGQWWRAITALTLHTDAGHLLANLVFGTLFGFLAGRTLGGGVAWLLIVVASAIANVLNVVYRDPAHTSVGASTAVFAALGIIVAYAIFHPGAQRNKRLRRWSPLIGGIVLLSYTGIGGERTDIGAHVAGGLMGLLIGAAAARLPDQWLANRELQFWTGIAAISIILIAWTVGLYIRSSS